ncbi:NAD(+)/NADH kinase [Pseudoruminococcus massiliensis]|uniref:NAD(+)/NADH kinase n=1 Tax=Pseudoruminococcus massiliensis TaxID=2086583 RepID=UPI003AB27154
MRALKRIALIPNLTKNGAYEESLKAIRLLKSFGGKILMTADLSEKYSDNDIAFFESHEVLIQKCDAVVTIGGDGTIIHAAKHAANFEKPLLGINMGRLGFVAELEPNELPMLERLFSGDYNVEKRQMLKVTLKSKSGSKSFFALNDAVISRGSMTKIIDLDVWLKKSYICHYCADGLIVSTPTGSSAYALSAGGPVIEPSMSCILMTPICSHSLFSRPVLFNPSSEILVNAASREDTDLTLTIDGETTIPITADDTVVITTAEIYAELIVLKDKTFYRVLSDKFTERGL